MSNFFQQYKFLLTVVLVCCLAAVLSLVIVQYRIQSLELLLRVQVTEQQAVLSTIAETTARNGADSVTEAIVIDCSLEERSRHDALLGRLDQGLSRSELIELDSLFGSCGSFYAERKSVMVARLGREIQAFDAQVNLLSTLTGSDESDVYLVDTWKELQEGEQSQRVFFNELVRLQQEIISELLAGKTAASPEISTILIEVQETRQSLLVAKARTDALREGLTSL